MSAPLLKQDGTGRLYRWDERLALRPDMRPYFPPERDAQQQEGRAVLLPLVSEETPEPFTQKKRGRPRKAE